MSYFRRLADQALGAASVSAAPRAVGAPAPAADDGELVEVDAVVNSPVLRAAPPSHEGSRLEQELRTGRSADVEVVEGPAPRTSRSPERRKEGAISGEMAPPPVDAPIETHAIREAAADPPARLDRRVAYERALAWVAAGPPEPGAAPPTAPPDERGPAAPAETRPEPPLPPLEPLDARPRTAERSQADADGPGSDSTSSRSWSDTPAARVLDRQAAIPPRQRTDPGLPIAVEDRVEVSIGTIQVRIDAPPSVPAPAPASPRPPESRPVPAPSPEPASSRLERSYLRP